MDKNSVQQYFQWPWLWLALLLAVSSSIIGPLIAAPVAGTSIANRATAQYYMDGNPNLISIESNQVEVIVQPQTALLLTANRNITGTPNSQVTLRHTLTNTGSTIVSYVANVTNLTGDGFDLGTLRLYRDINGNGTVDSGEPLITNSTVLTLLSRGREEFIIQGTIPPNSSGTSAQVRITVTSQGLNSQPYPNTDTITVPSQGTISLTKSASSLTPAAGDNVTFTLTLNKQGNIFPSSITVDGNTINYLLVRDNIPAKTTFVNFGNIGAAVPLYHIRGNAEYSFTTTRPTNLTQVDAVGFGFANPPASMTATVEFIVRVNPTANGSIDNIGHAIYSHSNGGNRTVTPSNTVQITVGSLAVNLTITKDQASPGRFVLGYDYRYAITVHNAGVVATQGTITVVDTLPTPYLTPIPATGSFSPGNNWQCRVSSPLITCTYASVINAGQSAPDLNLTVHANAVTTSIVTNNVVVSGGNEPSTATADNSDESESVVIIQSSSVTGMAWLDANRDLIYNINSETPLGGFKVELLCETAYVINHSTTADGTRVRGCNKPATVADTYGIHNLINFMVSNVYADPVLNYEVIGTATTSNQPNDLGQYITTSIPPGSGYALRFKYPGTEQVVGTPMNEDPNQETATAQNGVITGLVLEEEVVVILPLDPSGVIYDAETRLPISGAVVTFTGPSNFNATTQTVGGVGIGNQAIMTTDAIGSYQFMLINNAPNGTYSITVQASGYTSPSILIPASGTLSHPNVSNCSNGHFCVQQQSGPPTANEPTTYHLELTLGVGDLHVLNNHIPLDPLISASSSILLVNKTASRTEVELGDFLDYSIIITNKHTTEKLLDVQVSDQLPFGFIYVPGTARLNGAKLATEPASRTKPVFAIGDLSTSQSVTLTYRVRIGPGSLQGTGINAAQATAVIENTTSSVVSNISKAKVRVTAGVFTQDAFVIGKVFLDCNRNGIQDLGDLGIPGAQMLMENGISVTTDSLGKYSLYGLSPRTHVLRLDTSTLPSGAKILAISNRQAKRPNSRFLDLSKGELHKANFAIAGCPKALLDAVKERKKLAETEEGKASALDNTLKTQLTADGRIEVTNDTRALPATGVVGTTTTISQPMQTQGFNAVMPDAETIAPLAAQTEPRINSVAKIARAPLETLLPDLDNRLGFVGLKNHDTLPYAQANIAIKGGESGVLQLTVNGEVIPATRVGKKAVLKARQLEAWEYIGVDLNPGENILIATQIDSFGNTRGSETITVRAPDQLGIVHITVADTQYADGKTPVRVDVRLTDRSNVPVTVRTPLTLESELGKWQQKDLNEEEPGTQVFLEGGQGEYFLIPPSIRGESRLRVSSGVLAAERKLTFLEPLRPMIAVGVVEGALRLSEISINKLTPTRKRDGFQEEITQFTFGDGDKTNGGVRAALYLKGKVKGDYLLTLAYDSTKKETKDRLFRDIQPDEYYPVYGDSSVRGFDAQSNSRLYVRVDKGRSFVLYGDFTTQSNNQARVLSQHNRSLTGLKNHYENNWAQVNAFASQDSARQVIHEFAANGMSGRFFMPYASDMTINSEQVEVITRNRDQTSVIIQSETKQRYVDYTVDSFTGHLLFNAPVPAYDSPHTLNPNFIRVTYEVDLGGVKFWLYGADVQARVFDWLEIGAVAIKDEKPENPATMIGINSTVRLGEKTYLTGEVVQTDNMLTGKGQGERLELRHESTDIQARIQGGRTDKNFDNPSASLNQGRREVAGKISYKLAPSWNLKGEILYTADVTSGERSGEMVSIEHIFANSVRLEAGLRHSQETLTPADSNTGRQDDDSLNSVRLKATVPIFTAAQIYTEAERDIQGSDRSLLAVGGEYQFSSRGRAYARHEFISGISGPYSLNTGAGANRSTIAGLETDYMKDGQLFSEYRGRSAFEGNEPEAAVGLRNQFTLDKGLRLNASLERVQALSGRRDGTALNSTPAVDESTAATAAIEYTANPRWKGRADLEVRDGLTSDSILNTLALAVKISEEWTFLGRSIFAYTDNKEGSDTDQQRLQLGFAYRDAETDFWHLLGRYEYRVDRNGGSGSTTTSGTTTTSLPAATATGASNRRADVFSVHANYQPNRRWIISGRYAFKYVVNNSNGINSTGNGHLVGVRTTVDIARRWDLGFQSYVLMDSLASTQYALGMDVGYLVTEDLWFSLGYNIFGFRDRDFDNMGDTDRGIYVQLRYKFDESDLRRAAWWENDSDKTPTASTLYAED